MLNENVEGRVTMSPPFLEINAAKTLKPVAESCETPTRWRTEVWLCLPSTGRFWLHWAPRRGCCTAPSWPLQPQNVCTRRSPPKTKPRPLETTTLRAIPGRFMKSSMVYHPGKLPMVPVGTPRSMFRFPNFFNVQSTRGAAGALHGVG